MSDGHGRAAAHWFEIPVADLDRATAFYQAILDAPLRRESFGPPGHAMDIAIFPYDEPAVGGNLVPGQPSATGTVVYLNCDGKLDAVLARIEAAGGAVLMGRIELPPGMGSIAHIRDSEGNKVGLHSA